jgi:hypothetical protein
MGVMRPVHRLLRLAVLAVAPLLVAPAAGQAAPSAEFQLSVPSACYAGQCSASLYYEASRLPNQITLEVDWEHAGAPEAGFVPDSRLVCGPVYQTPAPPPPIPGYTPPPAVPYVVDYVDCEAESPLLRQVGASTVAVRITDVDGSQSYASRPLQVLPLPKEQATRRPTKGGRDIGGGRGGAGHALCASTPPAVKCQDGGGRQTAGGGEKVSHKGWPRITGVFWQVMDSTGRRKSGGPDNDELLGHHGSDRLDGGAGKDVLWGDWNPKNNNTWQKDTLIGGTGNDFIYPSHGTTKVSAGPGNDYIWAFYGKGTIDCGSGYDTVRVRMNGAFKLKGCEKVGHFCAHGPDGNGGCKKPGEAAEPRRVLPDWLRF